MSIFRSAGCVYCCMWCSALGVVAVVLRSRCVVLYTECVCIGYKQLGKQLWRARLGILRVKHCSYILYFKLSPCPECCMLSTGWFPGVWNFICRRFGTLFHLYRQVGAPTCLWRWDSVCPKRRHIKFRRRGITEKKAYNCCYTWIRKRCKVFNFFFL